MRFASRTSRHLARTIVVVALAILILLALAWRPAVAPIEPPAASGFDPALIRRGAELAALGDCSTCHTTRGGSTFAGGRAIPTPFGSIYSTNITPDPSTGIGRWSSRAFARAMREGVDREGRHLYPAFPYDHFTLLTDADIDALYAFFMTRPPVRAQTSRNDVPFPLSFRPLLAGWKLLFFRPGRYHADAQRDAVWNRGAYLAEGIAHCGACHTPRNAFGAEKPNQHFAGGSAEGWHAYSLNSMSQAPLAWDVSAMELYLRNGWHASHGVAHGPMAAVTDNMAGVTASDVRAVAEYVVASMSGTKGARPNSLAGKTDAEGTRRSSRASMAPLATAPPAAAISPTHPTAPVPPAAADPPTRSGAPTPGSSLQPATTPSASAAVAAASDDKRSDGAAIYAAACGGCHESHQPLPFGGFDLSLSTDVAGEDPTNLVHVVLDGLPATREAPQPMMPGFATTFSDPQLVSLMAYLRDQFAHKPL